MKKFKYFKIFFLLFFLISFLVCNRKLVALRNLVNQNCFICQKFVGMSKIRVQNVPNSQKERPIIDLLIDSPIRFLKIKSNKPYIPNHQSQGPEILTQCSVFTTCHMSCVTCYMSPVMCHKSLVFFFCKLVDLVDGGSVINKANPVQLYVTNAINHCCLLTRQGSPVDDRPSTNKLNHFVQNKQKKGN